VGCLIAGRWLPDLAADAGTMLRARLATLQVFASGLLVLGAAGFLLALIAGLSGAQSSAEMRGAMPDVLATMPGRDAEILLAVAIATLLVSIAGVGLWRFARPTVASALSALCWLAAIAVRAASGHAAEDGPVSLAVAWQAVHLLAISAWSGAVIVTAGLIPCLREPQQVRGLLARLSRMATVALAAVLVSGAVKSYKVLEPAPHLWPLEPWTRILVIKLAAVAVALVCAVRSRGLLRKPEWGMAEHRRSRINLTAESAAMLVILSLSALLGGTAPPGE